MYWIVFFIFHCLMYWCTILIINTIVHTHKRTMITLLAASFDQGIESFHFSMRMRRATSRRNALTSSPVRAASDTYIQSALRVTVHRIYSTIPVYNLISVSSSRGCIIVLVIDTVVVVVVVVVVQCFSLVRVLIYNSFYPLSFRFSPCDTLMTVAVLYAIFQLTLLPWLHEK